MAAVEAFDRDATISTNIRSFLKTFDLNNKSEIEEGPVRARYPITARTMNTYSRIVSPSLSSTFHSALLVSSFTAPLRYYSLYLRHPIAISTSPLFAPFFSPFAATLPCVCFRASFPRARAICVIYITRSAHGNSAFLSAYNTHSALHQASLSACRPTTRRYVSSSSLVRSSIRNRHTPIRLLREDWLARSNTHYPRVTFVFTKHTQ